MKAAALALSILCLGLVAGARGSSQAAQRGSTSIREVFVTNFPDPMLVDGEVSLKGGFVRTDEALVSPARLHEPTRMTPAGVLETGGFRTVVVSVSGEVKGQLSGAGRVGAVLVPELDIAVRAFEERGELIFPLLTATQDLTTGTHYFGSEVTEFTVAFPKYRIYLFNSTEENVSARFYAYLSS